MGFSERAYNVICKEIIPAILESWERVELSVLIAVKDVSLAYKGSYVNQEGVKKPLESYDTSWDFGDTIREWYESDIQTLEPIYKWNKIQFEIDQEGYAAVTTWAQVYYDHVYPNG